MSLGLQLISYKIAKFIDLHSSNTLKLKKNLNKIKKFIFDKKNQKKYECLKVEKKLNFIQDKLKRPIDVIKHQAKTVTVGAIRLIDNNINSISNNIFFINKKNQSSNNEGKFFELKKEINIISNYLYDFEKYYIGNIIDFCNTEFGFNKHYKFSNKKNNHKYSSSIITINNRQVNIKDKKKIYCKKIFRRSWFA